MKFGLRMLTLGDLCNRRTLIDLKVLEWAALLRLLYLVCFRAATDSWIWTIDSSPSFSVKSLMDSLVSFDYKNTVDVYSAIRLDQFPKKIKILA